MLDGFQNMHSEDPLNLKINLKPKLVDIESYDFVMSFHDPAYDGLLGFMGRDLIVTGEATNTDGSQFNFTADVTKLQVGIQEQPATERKLLMLNPMAKEFHTGPLVVSVG